MTPRVEPLGNHPRAAFRSGSADLDDWFRHRASQDQRRNVARVYVALDDELGVIGFYSLSSSAVSLSELPEDLRRKLPQYPLVPVVLIGRLARDERVRGTGLGEFLIASAVRRIVSAAEQVAAYAILVDAKDEPAAAFYRRFGFLPDPAEPLRLFLPLTTAAKALDLV